MKKVIFMVVLLAIVFKIYSGSKDDKDHADEGSPGGFVEVVMPPGLDNRKVYIMAPLNCSKEAGKRADALESEVRAAGIPVVRSTSVSLRAEVNSAEEKKKFSRTISIIEGEIPAVFISGRAKANPSSQQVISEYNRTN